MNSNFFLKRRGSLFLFRSLRKSECSIVSFFIFTQPHPPHNNTYSNNTYNSNSMQANSIATNTLLMPNVPSVFFTYPIALEHVRAKFEDFGILYAFVAMKGFGRLMIIYEETACAIKARGVLDKVHMSWRELITDSGKIEVTDVSIGEEVQATQDRPGMEVRLYYGQHNPINPDPTLFTLQVPKSEKNFLISPPGSPFEDWEQTMESPPNTAVLASDMTHAVAEMSDDDLDDLENFRLESPMPSDDETRDDNSDTTQQQKQQKQSSSSNVSSPDSVRSSNAAKRAVLKIVASSEDHPESEHVPSITVEDWDGNGEHQQQKVQEDSPKDRTTRSRRRIPPEFPKAKAIPTARPPVRT
ncbi:Calcipressin-domain-containing protein [Zychaea mexicana]|uniref:Calcipressin-domain-containing protein n=1 Tax=Zychaea mexicana TaxID=64656 RepID=UPI0022FEF54F|nr:Calcipressin-domain-containing protein [Zychaea mexicana]KAI9491070.1 Calcipressin-domain-containing protein [Zychaea mexicana]